MKNRFEGLGLEAIEYQRDGKLFAALTALITQLRGAASEEDRANVFQSMTAAVSHHTGILTIWQVEPFIKMAVVLTPPMTNTHSVIYKVQQKMLAAGKDPSSKTIDIEKTLNGKVDLKRSVISGDFCNIPATVLFPGGWLEGTSVLTPAEVAAVMLHEIGHFFTYVEFLGYTTATNLMLKEIASVWMDNQPIERRISVLKMVEATTGMMITDKEDIAKNDDVRVASTVAIQGSITKVRSELKTEYYDQRTWEFLADQFATRHGAGRDLVIAMDKVQRAVPWLFRDAAYRGTGSMMVANLIKFSLMTTCNMPLQVALRTMLGKTVIQTAVMSSTQALAEVGTGIGLTFLTSLLNDSPRTIDQGGDRYNTIRRDIVNDLKTKGLDKTYVQRTLEDLEIIDATIASMNKLDYIDKMLWNYIALSLTGQRKQVKLQQQYETLANNALFERAAQLSVV